jgi:hypothetical protein
MDAEDVHPSRRSLLKTGLAAAGARRSAVSAEAQASALRATAQNSIESAAVVTGRGFADGSRAAAVAAAPHFKT